MTRPPSLNYISSLPIFILTFNCSNGQFTFVASLPLSLSTLTFTFQPKQMHICTELDASAAAGFLLGSDCVKVGDAVLNLRLKRFLKNSDSVQKRFKSSAKAINHDSFAKHFKSVAKLWLSLEAFKSYHCCDSFHFFARTVSKFAILCSTWNQRVWSAFKSVIDFKCYSTQLRRICRSIVHCPLSIVDCPLSNVQCPLSKVQLSIVEWRIYHNGVELGDVSQPPDWQRWFHLRFNDQLIKNFILVKTCLFTRLSGPIMGTELTSSKTGKSSWKKKNAFGKMLRTFSGRKTNEANHLGDQQMRKISHDDRHSESWVITY